VEYIYPILSNLPIKHGRWRQPSSSSSTAMLLPLTLLYSSLFITTSALPVGAASSELTADTFTKTIEHGLWFVEHFSPYCGHCQQFEPTWKKLVEDSEKEFPQVKFATVNCVVHAGKFPT
jgi:thiol-disulfide isomerase/thioredoxin